MCKTCHAPVTCARWHQCLQSLYNNKDFIIQEHATSILVCAVPDFFIDPAMTISHVNLRTLSAPDPARACEDLTVDETRRALELRGLGAGLDETGGT